MLKADEDRIIFFLLQGAEHNVLDWIEFKNEFIDTIYRAKM